jgi:hypothetical protein
MNINSSTRGLFNIASASTKVNSTHSVSAPDSSEKTDGHLTSQLPQSKQTNSSLASQIKDSQYQAAFGDTSLDFSNMTIKEFHQVVKAVIEIDRDHEDKYGSTEPKRFGNNGNELISDKRSALLDLDITLEILSYGEGSVDPDEKINVMEYFANRKDKLTSMAETQPEIYANRATHSQELVQTMDEYFSEQALLEHQEQALRLLQDVKNNDGDTVWNNEIDVFV